MHNKTISDVSSVIVSHGSVLPDKCNRTSCSCCALFPMLLIFSFFFFFFFLVLQEVQRQLNFNQILKHAIIIVAFVYKKRLLEKCCM